ncbi:MULTISPECIES: hypothetical protein [Streptomyces]|uniref:Integrase n=1 Tax=Streptomyces solicathayae TaxID=3081768 RepID=A0ABZ0LPE0_9ACTN|nr:hypothetical protein [Streptomyces sp. HUAS YS2]WOX21371.1 hypothetical protein R2D22_08205 [Streptomyces sp. HUAS YS2]
MRHGRTADDPLVPPILGHRDYQHDPEVQENLALMHARAEARTQRMPAKRPPLAP